LPFYLALSRLHGRGLGEGLFASWLVETIKKKKTLTDID
jgi:hypothetical protein